MPRIASPAPDLLAGLIVEACDRRMEVDFARRWGGPVAGVDEVGRGPDLPAMSIRLRKTV
jgi:ribonuclease HII